VIFLDTNVLIAASIDGHPHHEACSRRLAHSLHTGAACAAHSMAECYSNLTRTGRGYGVPPLAAHEMVVDFSRSLSLIALTSQETMKTIQRAAEQGLAGPLLYDALLLACARKIDAKTIYTNDLDDFRRIAPDLADRIREP
jgi:predicted nucleic acid-binding protein